MGRHGRGEGDGGRLSPPSLAPSCRRPRPSFFRSGAALPHPPKTAAPSMLLPGWRELRHGKAASWAKIWWGARLVSPEPHAGQGGRPLSTLFLPSLIVHASPQHPSGVEKLRVVPTAPHGGAPLKQNAGLYRAREAVSCLLPQRAARVNSHSTHRVDAWAVVVAERVKRARFAVLGHFFDRDLGRFRHHHQLQGALLATPQPLPQWEGGERG